MLDTVLDYHFLRHMQQLSVEKYRYLATNNAEGANLQNGMGLVVTTLRHVLTNLVLHKTTVV